MALFTIIVLLILATIGDRVANAIAENEVANQFVKNGFPVKPSVTIEGFPFLTQVVAHDIHRIDISATNVPAGPVTITSVKAQATGVHLNSSFNGGTVDHITGTVFVSFSSLASAGNGGTGTGITMTADGPNQVKITAGLGPVSDTEVAKITQTGSNEISIQIENTKGSGVLGGLLSSFGSFSFNIPKLPAGLKITKVAVTSAGLTISASGTHTQLSEPSS
jgi:LmeA-like phospholipid-binding